MENENTLPKRLGASYLQLPILIANTAPGTLDDKYIYSCLLLFPGQFILIIGSNILANNSKNFFLFLLEQKRYQCVSG